MKYGLIFALFMMWTALFCQEDCFNGIDDDNDNLIDLNDDDCICDNNLIENGTLEGPCPTSYANGWASAYSQNYSAFSACNPNGIDESTYPAPGPEIIQLTSSPFSVSANIYQCLNEPLIAGQTYDFFYDYAITSGFLVEQSPPANSQIFVLGIVNCPDDYNAQPIFCPPSTLPPGLVLLDNNIFPAVFDTWNAHTFSFTPTQNLEGILIAAPCYSATGIYMLTQLTNFFIDGILIEQVDQPFFSAGTACTQLSASVDLSDINIPNPTGQWFLDGIAITGATDPSYDLPSGTVGELSFGLTNTNVCGFSEALQIIPPIFLDISNEITNNPCFGDDLGSIFLSLNNGAPLYQYVWDNGATSQDVSNLGDGIYSVTVTDSEGCTGSLQATISSPSLLIGEVVNIIAVDPFTQLGSATANGLGGSPEYTYLWSNGITTATNNFLPFGSHQVTVTDVNGCSTILEVEIPVLPLIVTYETTPSCSEVCNGKINVSFDGGLLPTSINWSDNSILFDRDDLCHGIYFATIEDFLGNSVEIEVVVESIPEVNLAFEIVEPACTDNAQLGDILLLQNQMETDFTFFWSNGASTSSLLNVSPGIYSLSTFDIFGCESNYSFEINALVPFSTQVINNNPICFADSTGNIDLIVTPMSDNISILWDSGQTTSKITNLPAGEYTALVSDLATGCSEEIKVLLSDPNNLQYELDYSEFICPNSQSGFISINTLDSLLKEVIWNTGSDSLILDHLIAGVYKATLKDTNECKETVEIQIMEYPLLSYTIESKTDSCNLDNGAIAIKVASTLLDTIIWNNSNFSGLDISAVIGSNWYSYELIDTNDCTILDSVFVNKILPIDYELIVTYSLCVASNIGSIILSSADQSAVFFPNNNDTIISNLNAGIYPIRIADINGCYSNDTILINNYPKPLIDVFIEGESCLGANDGMITIQSSTDISILWNDFGNEFSINELSEGLYYYTISDVNNCTYLDSAKILPGKDLSITIDEIQAITCLGDTGIYIIADNLDKIITINGEILMDEILYVTNSGIYQISVSDSNDICRFDTMLIVNILNTNVGFEVNNPSCGIDNGTIIVADENGIISNFTWSNNSSELNQQNLSSGDYTLTYSDATGCSYNQIFTLKDSPLPQLDFMINDISCYGSEDGSVELLVDGVVVDSFYVGSNIYENGSKVLGAGEFELSYTDSNGCTQNEIFIINSPPLLNISLIDLQNDIFSQGLGKAIVEVKGGLSPYNINWSNGVLDDTIISGLSSGTYIVEVTDANLCKTSLEVEILDFLLDVNYTYDNESCIAACDGSITISWMQELDLAIFWNDGVNNQYTRNELCPGEYSYSLIYQPTLKELYSQTILIEEGTQSPNLSIIPNLDTLYYNDEFISLGFEVVPSSFGTWNWLFENDVLCQDCEQITLGDEDGLIKLIFLNDKNCEAKDSIFVIRNAKIEDFDLPNIINVNNATNTNWTFPIPDYVLNISVAIYDRWGNKVYEDQDDINWDGRFKNEQVVSGVYVAKLIYFDSSRNQWKTIFQDITVIE